MSIKAPGIPAGVFDAIDGMIEESITRITEHEFVSRFLPILTDTSGEADISQWARVSRSVRLPVDVVRGREVLFRVPPLHREVISPARRLGQMPFSDIITQARLKSNVMSTIGDVYLDAATEDRNVYGSHSIEDLATWNMIFTRYGYPAITESPTVKVESLVRADGFSSLITDEYSEL